VDDRTIAERLEADDLDSLDAHACGKVPNPYDICTCYHPGVRWAVVLLLCAAVAQAAPQVEIRAKTQLSFGHVRLRDNGIVEISGKLLDKLTGDGIASQKVLVTLGTQTTWAFTEQDGSFRVAVAGAPGPQQVTLAYRGGPNARLEPADPLTVTTDPARAQVELTIVKVAGDLFRVRATTEEGPTVVPLTIEVGSPGKDDLHRVTTARSDADFALTRQAVGGPGLHRVRATFAGDDARQAAHVESTIEWTSATTTTIEVSNRRIAYEDKLGVSGKVVDEDGHPVARAAVTLMAGDRRLAQGATAEDGRYSFRVEAQIIAGPASPDVGERQLGLQVQSDPGQSFVKPSRSQPEVIAIRAPQPVPVSYTVAAAVATALAAGGFFAARGKPWQRLRRPTLPAYVDDGDTDIDDVQGGVVFAKPGILPALRRPFDDGISGVVRDTVRGRPIATATVRVADQETRTSTDGSFTLERLPAGELHVAVMAPGFVTETFSMTIPHRGELRGMRCDLVPVRERVFQLYRLAAEPVLPESRLWGVWTPRQIVDHVRSKRPTPALTELTDFVEEIYFSARIASETVLPQASERVNRAIQERGRR
jgi:hypothetical protein